MGIEISNQKPPNLPQEHATEPPKERSKATVPVPPVAIPSQAVNFEEHQKEMTEILQNLEKNLVLFNRRCEIRIDKSINRLIIKIIDKETDKVIKEIPPEEIQHLIANLKTMSGLLFDQSI